MQNLLASLINSIEAIISLLVLLFLFLGIFALLGTQVFGGKMPIRKSRMGMGISKLHSKPRSNFDSFSSALFTVFQVAVSLSPISYIPSLLHSWVKNFNPPVLPLVKIMVFESFLSSKYHMVLKPNFSW